MLKLQTVKFWLRSYHSIEDEIEELNDRIEVSEYALAHGISKGVFLTETEKKCNLPMPIVHGPKESFASRLEKLDELRAQKECFQIIKQKLDSLLNCMDDDDCKLVRRIFIENIRLKDIAEEQGVARNQIYAKSNQALRNAIKLLNCPKS